MKTAVITGYGDIEKIIYLTEEKPILKDKELLIKVEAFALNPKDILIRKGKFRKLSGKNFPQKIGFEFAGIVMKTSNNSQFKINDKVFGLFGGWQGQCSTRYLCIKEKQVWLMPKNSSFHNISGIALAGSTALQALRDLGKIKAKSNVCINGASGGVGTLAIQVAKSFSAEVTTVSSDENIGLCQSLGANNVVDYNSTDILKSHVKYDIFFDVFGNYSFDRVKHLLTQNGSYITTVPSTLILKQKFLTFFRKQKTQLVIVKSKQKDLCWLAKHVSKGQIKPVVDKIYPFEEIKQAQVYLQTKRAKGKVVISLQKP